MTTMSRLYERELAVAIRAVREAARLCRAVGAEISSDVLAKKDKSPVTVADFGSQALICRALLESFPDDPVIAEEDAAELRSPENSRSWTACSGTCARSGSRRPASEPTSASDQVCEWIDRGGSNEYQDRFWTLDPIDGTKGFLRGEQYAVALALDRRRRGCGRGAGMPAILTSEPVAGMARIRKRCRESARRDLHCRQRRGSICTAGRITQRESSPWLRGSQVNATDDPAEVRFCESVESGHSAHGDAADVAARLGITAAPLRMDSQAKYAVVARGEAEIYLRLPTRADYREKIWDHAAGALDRHGGRRGCHRHPWPSARIPSRARARCQPRRDRQQRPAAREGDPGDREIGIGSA